MAAGVPTKMGFEGKIYYGVGGAEATTEIPCTRDITYTMDVEKVDTSCRPTGAATLVPRTERVISLLATINFQTLNDPDDATIEALKAAAAAATSVAIRTKDYTSGKGFDGDVVLSMTHGMPYRGEQTLDFVATPTEDCGRTPQFHV